MMPNFWTRNELILAFNLYCRTPFGRIHTRNPEIITLAALLGRTPSAVSWKLANFARLDPSLKARKVAGAAHGSKQEMDIWKEFNDDWDKLAFESESLLLTLKSAEAGETFSFPEGKTRQSLVRTRINQGFFRAAVLASYEGKCCITGIPVAELLVASHIVPWSKDSKNRTNPRNGLCLSAMHDKAFDCGLITVTPDCRVKLSPRLRELRRSPGIAEYFLKFEGSPLTAPRRFAPDRAFLEYHNDHIFQR